MQSEKAGLAQRRGGEEGGKEKGILFSAVMVLAIMGGRKTMTRRTVKFSRNCWKPNALTLTRMQEGYPDGIRPVFRDDAEPNLFSVKCPYGRVGDRLRVREDAWMWCERRPNGTTKKGNPKWRYEPLRSAPVYYCANMPVKPEYEPDAPETGNQWGWRKKLGRFLPKWASRITLEVTGVRVERLQEISVEDCRAEGIGPMHIVCPVGGKPHPDAVKLAYCTAYRLLWESINGPGSWALNPWVWVIEWR